MPSHACERCHRRKVRCDKAVPCGPCRRSDVECEYAVSETQVRRRHVEKLEGRIRDLQAANEELTTRLSASPRGYAATSPVVERANRDVADEVIHMSLIAGGGSNFVGSTSGLLLANLLQPRPSPGSSSTLSLPVALPPVDTPWQSGTASPGAALPPRSLAEDLLRAYCSHDHLAYPFLSTRSLHRSLEEVYAGMTPVDPVRAFFVDMTLAIATAQVHKFNWRGVYSAETHCHRAMARLGDVLARDGIERVQALLLICQYRMGTTSSDTSTSVWHLIGVAARTCTEMGLHRASTYADSGAEVQEDMETRKRCFWSLVALDRITSLALGRPLAIQLEDIDVDFPERAGAAEERPAQDSPLSTATYGTPGWSAATSIFVHIVKYRLVCGKVLNALHRSPKHTPGDLSYSTVRQALEQELREWHAQTSSLQLVREENPLSPANSSSFRCEEWYTLLFHNGMLMLFRPSPVLCDAPRNSTALQRIYEASGEAIRLYAHLHRSNKMNYSWVTMQSVFIAGLSYIYALRNHFQADAEGERSRLIATPTITAVVNATRACSRVLVAVSERWGPARNCSDLFDRLSDAVIADVVDAQSAAAVAAAGATPRPTPVDPVQMDDLGHPAFMGMTVDTAFRDCFGDLQNLGLDAFHHDALAQLSQGWFRGLEGDVDGFY